MPVHVSIHDVSPAWADEVEAALTLCASAGVRPALLVVPNFHGRAPLLDDSRFCARLRELQAAGHEIYQHGFFHRSRLQYDAANGTGSRLAWLRAARLR
jgi:predicted deacetylase